MSIVKNLLGALLDVFRPYVEQEERAVAWSALYEQAYAAISNAYPDMWFHELYQDNGSTYAIASQMGTLYRMDVAFVDGKILMGEPQSVQVEHVPVGRSLTVRRELDGRYRWVGVASTAILNRSNEVDSTALFDDFITRFNQQDLEESPVHLDFWHTDILLGTVDWIGRDGYVLLASGLLAEGELGEAIANELERDPAYWGQSITFRVQGEPSMIEVMEGVSFPVWEQGVLRRIALLPQDHAAAWFTTMNLRSVDMNKTMMDALRRLVGDEAAEALAGTVDSVNQRASDPNVIARSTAEGDVDPVAGDDGTAEVPQSETETVSEADMIRGMVQQMTDLTEVARGILDTVNGLEQRVTALEATDAERQRAWLADLPTGVQTRPLVRPRQEPTPGNQTQTPDTSNAVRELLRSKGIVPG